MMAYTNILFLIPKFLTQKKFFFYFLSVILGIALLAIVRIKIIELASEFDIRKFNDEKRQLVGFVFNMVVVYLISTAFHFVREWFRNNRLHVELENKQLESELKFLKTQINPHFLFNILNNIYTLCYLKDDKAAPSVMKLSEIMRYMLHESNVEKIELSKEIHIMENYIELQRLKKDDPALLDVTFNWSTVKGKHIIAPLLLITFFENSFKHGDIDINPHGWIRASIDIDEKDLMYFQIENTKRTGNSEGIERGNIGLENVRKRLDLLYADAYTLHIADKKDTFKVDLKIPLIK